MSATAQPVTVDEYVHFREQGSLIVRNLVAPDEVQELLDHVDDLLAGRVDVPDAAAFGADNNPAPRPVPRPRPRRRRRRARCV